MSGQEQPRTDSFEPNWEWKVVLACLLVCLLAGLARGAMNEQPTQVSGQHYSTEVGR